MNSCQIFHHFDIDELNKQVNDFLEFGILPSGAKINPKSIEIISANVSSCFVEAGKSTGTWYCYQVTYKFKNHL